jgi:Undecaprenyl-phosphate glucose phosphotransferase
MSQQELRATAGRYEAGSSASLVSYRTVGQLVAILDYILIVAACFAAGYGYHLFILYEKVSYTPYFAIGNVSAILFIVLSHSLYRTTYLISPPIQLRGIIINWTIVLFSLFLMLFLLKIGERYSRGALTLFSFLGFGLLIGSRLLICNKLRHALARGTLAGYPAVIVGDSDSLENLSRLQILQKFGAYELGRFEVPAAGDEQGSLGVVDEAIALARSHDAERVLLAVNWGDSRLRDLICERLQLLPLPVLLLPDRNITSILSHPGQNLVREFSVEVQRPPLSAAEFAAKRMVDLTLGGAILLSLIPLIGVVGLLIKITSPGPVIFRQRRKGFNGREFTIYKFRTMTVLEDGDVIRQAQRGDARITRLGRILRATSIDELPQLINVLLGQMSLVGPRPHAVAHDDGYGELIANYAFRQHVKPGLTGWAQVNGLRGETRQLQMMEQRVSLDLWYIQNWSFWLDLRIIALTLFELARGQNAY